METITAHLQDTESINGWYDKDNNFHPGFGVVTGSPIQVTNIESSSILTGKIQGILDRQSKPIYQATIRLTRFPDVEEGQPLFIPDHPKVKDKTFIVSDVTIQGTTANWVTTINATTDINVVSRVSEFQAVQAIAKHAVHRNAPRKGVVIESVGGVSLIQLDEGGVPFNVWEL